MTSRRTARLIAKLAIVPVALIASGILVATASYSAYSANTTSPTSTWASGTVKLADDDSSVAMFNASNLKPGATGSKCITVTSSGSLASTVKLYATDATASATKNLDKVMDLTITRGTGGSFGSCSGYVAGSTVYSGSLADFATSATDFGSGVGAWTVSGGTFSTTYQITYTLSADASNKTQGGTASLGFTWEAQNS